jgi:ribonucleotide reductase alpha subunit
LCKETRQNYFDNKERVLFLIQKYKTMYEISQKDILKKARQRAIYIDQTQSTNIFLDNVTVSKVRAVHYYGHKLGLKTGIYYLRQKGDNKKSTGLSINPMYLEYIKSREDIVVVKETTGKESSTLTYSSNDAFKEVTLTHGSSDVLTDGSTDVLTDGSKDVLTDGQNCRLINGEGCLSCS